MILEMQITLLCLYSVVYIEIFFYYNGVATTEGTGVWTPET